MSLTRSLIGISAVLAAVAAFAPATQAAAPQTRIIAGTDAADSQFPYQARLSIRRADGTYQCGAVIRDSLHVMTAGHCVVSGGVVSAPSSVTVYYGAADRTAQRGASVYAVEPAARYVAGDGTYDAALITLAAPLAGYGGANVRGVALATPSELASAVGSAQAATVSGWGLTEQNTVSRVLRSTSVTLRADSVCQRTYGSRTFAAARFVCAGGTGTAQSGNADSCSGDSGGPLVFTAGGTVKLAGLVSFGSASGCGRPNVPAAYTETSNPEIYALLTGQTLPPPVADPVVAGPVAPPASVPAPARPVVRPPSAGLGGLRCRKRVCVVRVTSHGTRLTARVSRRAKRCYLTGRDRFCRTIYTKTTVLKPNKTASGYTMTVKLKRGAYRFTAVASDGEGRRSDPVTKQFRVRG